MYLSRLRLNPTNRAVLRDLASPNDLHKTLWRAFPSAAAGGAGRVLFRVEPADAGAGTLPTVLVQSERQPDWTALPSKYLLCEDVNAVVFSTGGVAAAPDVVPVRDGDRFRFRLVANVTKKQDGKRHGLYREEDQRVWLARKADQGGFEVVAHSLLVVPMGTIRSRVDGAGDRSWLATRFEGRLRVTEPSHFVQILECGIGPAKAFGFGLLSIARG